MNVSLRFATPQAVAKTVRFVPDIKGADAQVILEKYYDVSLTAGVGTESLSGSIPLPVPADGAISYRVEFPTGKFKDARYIELTNGSSVDLSELLTA